MKKAEDQERKNFMLGEKNPSIVDLGKASKFQQLILNSSKIPLTLGKYYQIRCYGRFVKLRWVLYYTSLNPQNLRNIIKKVEKISIFHILMSSLSVKTIVFCYFLQLFRYPTNFARLR